MRQTDHRDRGLVRVRGYVSSMLPRISRVVAEQRSRRSMVDVVVRLYERDREVDGSMLASAVALRIFLFFLPLLLLLVAALGFVSSHLSANDPSRQLGVTGGLATQISHALHQSSRARWLALVSGLFGAPIAGRNLARALTIAARRSWRLPPRTSVRTARVIGSVTGLVISVGALAVIVNRVRESTGVVAGSLTVVGAAAAYAAVWFVVCLGFPRGRADRTSLLPGALCVGIGLATTQWLLQFQGSERLARASQLYGSIGTVVVALSWFFIAGRLLVVSFTIDAVVWERFSSLASVLLRWSVLARLVERHRGIGRFLDLNRELTTADADPPGAGEGASSPVPEHDDDARVRR